MSSKLLLFMALLLFSTQTNADDKCAEPKFEKCNLPQAGIDYTQLGTLGAACTMMSCKSNHYFDEWNSKDDCVWQLVETLNPQISAAIKQKDHTLQVIWDAEERRQYPHNRIDTPTPEPCIDWPKKGGGSCVYDASKKDASKCDQLSISFELYCVGEFTCLANTWRTLYENAGCNKELARANDRLKTLAELRKTAYNASEIHAKCQAVLAKDTGITEAKPMATPKTCKPVMDNMNTFSDEEKETLADCHSFVIDTWNPTTANCVSAACNMSVLYKRLKKSPESDTQCFPLIVASYKDHFEKIGWDSDPVCKEIVESDGADIDKIGIADAKRPSECDLEVDVYVRTELAVSQDWENCTSVMDTHGIIDTDTRMCIGHSCRFYDMQNHISPVCRTYDFNAWKSMIERQGLESNKACIQFVDSNGTDVDFRKFEPIDHRCGGQLRAAESQYNDADRKVLEDCPSRIIGDEATSACVNMSCQMSIIPKYMEPDCGPFYLRTVNANFENNNIASNPVCKEIIESNGAKIDFSHLTDGKTKANCTKEVVDAPSKLTPKDVETIGQCNGVLNGSSIDDKTRVCIILSCDAHLRLRYISKACIWRMFNAWNAFLDQQGLTTNPACMQFTVSQGTNVDFTKIATRIEAQRLAMDESTSTSTHSISDSSSAVSWTVTLALSVIYAVIAM